MRSRTALSPLRWCVVVILTLLPHFSKAAPFDFPTLEEVETALKADDYDEREEMLQQLRRYPNYSARRLQKLKHLKDPEVQSRVKDLLNPKERKPLTDLPTLPLDLKKFLDTKTPDLRPDYIKALLKKETGFEVASWLIEQWCLEEEPIDLSIYLSALRVMENMDGPRGEKTKLFLTKSWALPSRALWVAVGQEVYKHNLEDKETVLSHLIGSDPAAVLRHLKTFNLPLKKSTIESFAKVAILQEDPKLAIKSINEHPKLFTLIERARLTIWLEEVWQIPTPYRGTAEDPTFQYFRKLVDTQNPDPSLKERPPGLSLFHHHLLTGRLDLITLPDIPDKQTPRAVTQLVQNFLLNPVAHSDLKQVHPLLGTNALNIADALAIIGKFELAAKHVSKSKRPEKAIQLLADANRGKLLVQLATELLKARPIRESARLRIYLAHFHADSGNKEAARESLKPLLGVRGFDRYDFDHVVSAIKKYYSFEEALRLIPIEEFDDNLRERLPINTLFSPKIGLPLKQFTYRAIAQSQIGQGPKDILRSMEALFQSDLETQREFFEDAKDILSGTSFRVKNIESPLAKYFHWPEALRTFRQSSWRSLRPRYSIRMFDKEGWDEGIHQEVLKTATQVLPLNYRYRAKSHQIFGTPLGISKEALITLGLHPSQSPSSRALLSDRLLSISAKLSDLSSDSRWYRHLTAGKRFTEDGDDPAAQYHLEAYLMSRITSRDYPTTDFAPLLKVIDHYARCRSRISPTQEEKSFWLTRLGQSPTKPK